MEQAQGPEMTAKPPVEDPADIRPTYCDGPQNVTLHPPLATITLTTQVPNADALFNGRIEITHQVAARLTMTIEALNSLRDIIDQTIGRQDKVQTTAHPKGDGRPN